MSTNEQKFCINYAKDAPFKSGGLRDYLEYRDLGIDAATKGRYGAQVIRAKEACAGGKGRHTHDLDFQLVYVLNGWIEFAYGGEGEFRLGPGDSVLQPSGIKHELLACSDDCEVLEITSPAEFGTVHE